MIRCKARAFFGALAIVVAWSVLGLGGEARAQSTCPYIYAAIPPVVLTAGQWNGCFAAKQDALGFIPIPQSGGTFTGKITTAPATTAQAGFNLAFAIGIPAAPKEGDMWDNIQGLWIEANGRPMGPITDNYVPPAITVGSYTTTSLDCDRSLQFGSGSTGSQQITLSSTSGVYNHCKISFTNADSFPGRGKQLTGFPAPSPAYLFPGQSITVQAMNNAWRVVAVPGRWKVGGTLNLFADFTNGSDANDGLSAGSGNAKKSLNGVRDFILSRLDCGDPSTLSPLNIVVNMARRTADTTGLSLGSLGMVGCHGSTSLTIQGATAAITGAADNGSGAVRLTIASTSGFATGDDLCVRNVLGATQANGCWKITVVDGVHVDLQGSSFGSAYTSGGTIADGSSTSIDVAFGTVVQVKDLALVSATADLSAHDAAKAIPSGVMFMGTSAPSTAAAFADSGGRIELGDVVGFGGATSYNASILALEGGSFRTLGKGVFVTDSFSIIEFATASGSGSVVDFSLCPSCIFGSGSGSVINLAGNTVGGSRYLATNGGTVVGDTHNNQSYFPGNTTPSISGNAQAAGQYEIDTGVLGFIYGGTGCATLACEQGRLELGLTLLNVLTASGTPASMQDTVTFNLFTTYDDYELTFDNCVPVTTAVEPQLQVQSGGVMQTTGYINQAGAATTYISLSNGVSTVFNGAGTGITGTIRIHNVNSTTANKYVEALRMAWYSAAGVITSNVGIGAWNGGTGALQGWKFMFSSGNIQNGCVIKTYGLRNAL